MKRKKNPQKQHMVFKGKALFAPKPKHLNFWDCLLKSAGMMTLNKPLDQYWGEKKEKDASGITHTATESSFQPMHPQGIRSSWAPSATGSSDRVLPLGFLIQQPHGKCNEKTSVCLLQWYEWWNERWNQPANFIYILLWYLGIEISMYDHRGM